MAGVLTLGDLGLVIHTQGHALLELLGNIVSIVGTCWRFPKECEAGGGGGSHRTAATGPSKRQRQARRDPEQQERQ